MPNSLKRGKRIENFSNFLVKLGITSGFASQLKANPSHMTSSICIRFRIGPVAGIHI